MITYQEKQENINKKQYNMSDIEIKQEQYGYVRYIIDISLSSKSIPSEVTSIAILLTHYFFIKNSYKTYDKRIISCASILIALKSENAKGRLCDLVRIYLLKESKLLQVNNKETSTSLSDHQEKIKSASYKIGIAEMTILKTVKFNSKYLQPSSFIYIYVNLLINEEHQETVLTTALKIESDSFFTLVNNLFHPFIVALACISISQEMINMKDNIISDGFHANKDNLQKIKVFYMKCIMDIHGKAFNKCTSLFGFSIEEFNMMFLDYDDNSFSETYDKYAICSHCICVTIKEKVYQFDDYFSFDWFKRFHPFIEKNDIFLAIDCILEFYYDMKDMIGFK